MLTSLLPRKPNFEKSQTECVNGVTDYEFLQTMSTFRSYGREEFSQHLKIDCESKSSKYSL